MTFIVCEDVLEILELMRFWLVPSFLAVNYDEMAFIARKCAGLAYNNLCILNILTEHGFLKMEIM